MALDASALQSAIRSHLDTSQPSQSAAASALANIYDSYAADGAFGASVPDLTGCKDAFAAAFLPISAASLAAAVAAYWGTSTVPVAGASGVGTVAGCPGASGISAALAPLLATANTRDVAAAALASALDTATKTVTAFLTLPPAPPATVPIA